MYTSVRFHIDFYLHADAIVRIYLLYLISLELHRFTHGTFMYILRAADPSVEPPDHFANSAEMENCQPKGFSFR